MVSQLFSELSGRSSPTFPAKRWWTSIGLQGVKSQKILLFIATGSPSWKPQVYHVLRYQNPLLILGLLESDGYVGWTGKDCEGNRCFGFSLECPGKTMSNSRVGAASFDIRTTYLQDTFQTRWCNFCPIRTFHAYNLVWSAKNISCLFQFNKLIRVCLLRIFSWENTKSYTAYWFCMCWQTWTGTDGHLPSRVTQPFILHLVMKLPYYGE